MALYIGNMFHKFKDKKTHSMVPRNNLHNLHSPKPKITLFKNSFAYSSTKLYNEFPIPIRLA